MSYQPAKRYNTKLDGLQYHSFGNEPAPWVKQGAGFFYDLILGDTTMSKFKGFPKPSRSTNYFSMPNCWTDVTAEIKSLAELKVIEYVLRHTWGWESLRKSGKARHITLDEFENGRKTRSGNRMDKGTGLNRTSIRNGLTRAEEHGYLEIETDDQDRGRIKKSYRLKMTGVNKSQPEGEEVTARGGESHPLVVKKSPPYRESKGNKVNQVNENGVNTPSDPPGTDHERPKNKRTKKEPSKFDLEAARRLGMIVDGADKLNGRSDIRGWAKDFRLLREHNQQPTKEIKATLRWYKDHIGQEYVPQCFSGISFREKYNNLRMAMERNVNGSNGNGTLSSVVEEAQRLIMKGIKHGT